MQKSDVVAYLDMLERKIQTLAIEVRQLRFSVFDGVEEDLDNDDGELLD